MPSSQAAAAERRNDRADESFQVTNEPPKLRTTLKTPPKQATNPLQFVKVGPCSLYRTAQEQLSKVQEVKKVKQEVRDDPEDWQSNLDNWKSSRRKRQEHIIERVVEAKKLEEEEHSRQRRKGKTFSEMIEERGNRGRKLSISLNIFNDEEGSNELSDLGTGVGSNKSSISGDNHDDNQSIISDRDNEMEKNQSDSTEETTEDDCIKEDTSVTKKPNYVSECDKKVCSQKYEPTISDETKSSESDEYTYEGAIRTYVTRVSQNIPRNSAVSLEAKFEVVDFSTSPVVQEEKTIPVKVDILKRREIFEKASQQQNSEAKANSKLADVELIQSKSIKERLTHLERIKSENDKVEKKVTNSVLADTSTVRDLLSNLEKQETVQRNSSFNAEELDNVLPLKERLLTLREYEQPKSKSKETKIVKEDKQLADKKAVERENVQTNDKYSNASNDEYQSSMRISRTQFHRSLDSLDEDASSRPDSYERVQSLEELDYQKYDAFTSSNEILNDTDREDSGIQTTDVSWSVSQTDESVDDGINNTVIECVVDNKMNCTEDRARDVEHNDVPIDRQLVSKDTAETSSGDDLLVNKYQPHSNNNNTNSTAVCSTSFQPTLDSSPDSFEFKEPPEKWTETVPTKTEHTSKTDLTAPIIIEEIYKVKIPNNQAKQECLSPFVRSPSKIPILSQKTSTSLPPSPSSLKNLSFSKLRSFNSADHSPTSPQTNSLSQFPAPFSSFKSPRVPSLIPESTSRPVLEDSHRADTQIADLDKMIPKEVSELDNEMQLNQNGTETSLYNENDSDVEVNCRTSSTESTGPSTNIAKPFTPKIDSIKEQIERPTSLNLMSTVNKEPIVPLMNSSNMLPLSLSSDEELLTSPTFPLGPPTSMDPPKEKPPPPPTDLSDDENRSNASLKRLNSTRRIKQELRSRRSDFLGIEGTNDEELERELTLNKPPDMAAILAEERRIDQLHCRSYDTDSNYDQDSSHERDSGVELGHVEDWTKQPISPDMSQHSRQSSEPFGASITSSEEDELQKKEQEIIDVLEKEEQWRYRNEHNLTSDIADKFGHKVIGLEKINVKLGQERDKYGKLTKEKQEDSTTTQQKIIKNKEEQPVEKEFNRVKTHFDNDGNHEQKTNAILNNEVKTHDDEFSQRDIFRVEQELLQLEQEELKRQRTHMALKEQKQQQQLAGKIEEQWKSRQEEENEKKNTQQFSLLAPLHYRTSMPNLQSQEGLRRRPPPPPPILPSKPLMLEQHREYSMRNNRIPSADSIPQQVNASLRHSASVTSLSSQSSQQMTRQTLQALSAAPRSRIVQGDQWVQRRKSDTPRTMHDCNYQHWLIQEAEQRRISEVNQKSPSRKSQQHVTGTSVLPPATSRSNNKPLPDSIIRTLTQRVQNRVQEKSFLKRRFDQNGNQDYQFPQQPPQQSHIQSKPYQPPVADGQDKVLSVSGKKKCSHCGEELGRGAAMIIESLRLFYHMECFKCCVCHIRLGDGLMGTDVRVRNHKLHCHNCYSSDDGVKFSCV